MSGVTKFVHRQNGVAQLDGTSDAKQVRHKSTHGQNDDLKVRVGTPDTPSRGNRPRANSQRPRGGGQGGPSTRSRSQAEQQPATGGGMLDTDASNADRTSGPGSVQLINQGAEPASGQHHQQDAHVHQDSAQARNFANRRTSGDSYPATTSGRPSEVDASDAYRKVPVQINAQGMHELSSTIPTRDLGGSRGPADGAIVPLPNQSQVEPRNKIVEDVAQAFQYQKASGSMPNVSHPNIRHPHAIQQPLPPPHFSQQLPYPQHNNPPQVRTAPSQAQHISQALTQPRAVTAQNPCAIDKQELADTLDKHHSQHGAGATLREVANQYPTPEGRRPTRSPRNVHQDYGTHVEAPESEQPQSDMQADGDRLHSESRFQNSIHGRGAEDLVEDQLVETSPDQQRWRDMSPELDIAPSELFRMDYADVKARPFDIDPHARTLNLPQDMSPATFQEKLIAAMPIGTQGQAEFFAAMTAEQWEDAGDWFIEQFSDLVGKLKDSRKEKRKAARAFEDEIEQRHESVIKKQRLTMSALNEMKESGGKVLKGTPTKLSRPRREK